MNIEQPRYERTSFETELSARIEYQTAMLGHTLSEDELAELTADVSYRFPDTNSAPSEYDLASLEVDQ